MQPLSPRSAGTRDGVTGPLSSEGGLLQEAGLTLNSDQCIGNRQVERKDGVPRRGTATSKAHYGESQRARGQPSEPRGLVEAVGGASFLGVRFNSKAPKDLACSWAATTGRGLPVPSQPLQAENNTGQEQGRRSPGLGWDSAGSGRATSPLNHRLFCKTTRRTGRPQCLGGTRRGPQIKNLSSAVPVLRKCGPLPHSADEAGSSLAASIQGP